MFILSASMSSEIEAPKFRVVLCCKEQMLGCNFGGCREDSCY
jgi:hypothetical protein